MKKQTERDLSNWILLVFGILLVVLFGIILTINMDDYDKKCLAERLCWENHFEYNGHTSYPDKVFCYEVNKKGDNLLKEFININWTELDKRFVCKGG